MISRAILSRCCWQSWPARNGRPTLLKLMRATFGSPVYPLRIERLKPIAHEIAHPNEPEYRPDGRAYLQMGRATWLDGRPIMVSLEDCWAIAGIRGGGKTYFAKRLVRRLSELWPHASRYILQSKNDDDFAGWPGLVEQDDAPHALTRAGSIQLWHPSLDDQSAYDEWFGRILKAHNRDHPAIVYIDELSAIGGRTGLSFPLNFSRLLKQGRGLAICCITLTQDVAYIPRQVISQATWIARFRLQNESDERTLDKHLWHDGKRHEPSGKYGFHLKRTDRHDDPLSFRNAAELLAAL